MLMTGSRNSFRVSAGWSFCTLLLTALYNCHTYDMLWHTLHWAASIRRYDGFISSPQLATHFMKICRTGSTLSSTIWVAVPSFRVGFTLLLATTVNMNLSCRGVTNSSAFNCSFAPVFVSFVFCPVRQELGLDAVDKSHAIFTLNSQLDHCKQWSNSVHTNPQKDSHWKWKYLQTQWHQL